MSFDDDDNGGGRRAASRRRSASPPKGKRDRAAETKPVLHVENPQTGEIRQINMGFAWTLFLFSGVFGLPLFLRGLPSWGAVFVALWAVDLLAVWQSSGNARTAAEAILFAVFLVLQLWLGFTGNTLTARTYLARGWTIAR
jgi:hypothetical protein